MHPTAMQSEMMTSEQKTKMKIRDLVKKRKSHLIMKHNDIQRKQSRQEIVDQANN